MCGTAIRKCSSTRMRPRSVAITPAAARLSVLVLLFLPAMSRPPAFEPVNATSPINCNDFDHRERRKMGLLTHSHLPPALGSFLRTMKESRNIMLAATVSTRKISM